MPNWDANLMLKYNLRDKIIAGVGINALGKRNLLVTKVHMNPFLNESYITELPAAMLLNISAEYRYTKILSFWAKLSNISFSKYYEWAYFPTQRFMFLVGFTYSL
jgi:outer membrane receptor for ferrienterochelin and colicin